MAMGSEFAPESVLPLKWKAEGTRHLRSASHQECHAQRHGGWRVHDATHALLSAQNDRWN